MTTLPEDIEALSRRAVEICQEHGIDHINLSIYSGSKTEKGQLTLKLTHDVGEIKINKEYFIIPKTLDQIAPKVREGVSALITKFNEELLMERKELEGTKHRILGYEAKIDMAQKLIPTPLDQIIHALDEEEVEDEEVEVDY